MNDRTLILPLLASEDAPVNRRQRRVLQWREVIRWISRKRLKAHLLVLALLVITIITIFHKVSVENRHELHTTDKSRILHRRLPESRTMRTIIAKYMGPDLSKPVDDKTLNENNYNPDPQIGKEGRPAYLAGYPQERIKLLYQINRFNLVASDKISVDRRLPDARKMACRKVGYNNTELPNTSIIIVFHNEAWSTLVRTVHSILNTSPSQLIAEILLVDDASNRTFLGTSLDYYMNNLSSVRGVEIRVLRSKERVGLIRSRLIGVEAAIGKVLTFIDAHCEATKGWLEPLLDQIRVDRKTAACPIIDIINDDNFAFTRSFELHMGAFNWGLNFRWFPISRRELLASNGFTKREGKTKLTELIQPFRTPVMAGGLFSIDRSYFEEIGLYDPKMDIWGGENIELSLRLWQCGGQVKIVPCSHVGHIFRKSSPYTFRPGKEVGDILYTNLARVAEVWMDDWKSFFYSINPVVNKTLVKVGKDAAFEGINDRKLLRERLKCRGFDWFLSDVWPEHFFPTKKRFFGRLQQVETQQCLQRPISRGGLSQAPVGALTVHKCSNRFVPHQLFVFDKIMNRLMTDENVCLDSGSDPIPTRQVIMAPCSESLRQIWHYNDDSQLVHVQSSLCLDSPNPTRVQLENCTSSKRSLEWSFAEEKWTYKMD